MLSDPELDVLELTTLGFIEIEVEVDIVTAEVKVLVSIITFWEDEEGKFVTSGLLCVVREVKMRPEVLETLGGTELIKSVDVDVEALLTYGTVNLLDPTVVGCRVVR